MSPPEVTETETIRVKDFPDNIPDRGTFANLEELLFYEEKNVLDLLAITLKTAPIMLGQDGVKRTKNSGKF